MTRRCVPYMRSPKRADPYFTRRFGSRPFAFLFKLHLVAWISGVREMYCLFILAL